MAVLNTFIEVLTLSYVPAANNILGGMPINYAGNPASANDPIIGIAREDINATDLLQGGSNPVSSVLKIGSCLLTGGAAISAGAPIKVGTSQQFIAATMPTDLEAGYVVGVAKIACSGAGATFEAIVGVTG